MKPCGQTHGEALHSRVRFLLLLPGLDGEAEGTWTAEDVGGGVGRLLQAGDGRFEGDRSLLWWLSL